VADNTRWQRKGFPDEEDREGNPDRSPQADWPMDIASRAVDESPAIVPFARALKERGLTAVEN
jgi:hypothetical protein